MDIQKMRLSGWAANHSAEKRLLITQNSENALRLIRRANAHGIERLNMDVRSLRNTAAELLIEQNARNNIIKRIELLDNTSCVLLLDSILNDNIGKFEFLPEKCMGTSTSGAVLDIINKLRMGCTTDAYRDSDDKKLAELSELTELYENRIGELYKSDGVLDYAMLISLALDAGSADKYSCAYFAEEEYTHTEMQLLKKLGAESISMHESTADAAELGKRCKFYRAYGVENESIFAADMIKNAVTAENKKMPLGETAVYYTNEEYESIIQGVFQSRGIPCALTSGCSALRTNIVSFVVNILKWAENGFVYKDLAEVVSNPVIDVKTKGCYPYSQFLGCTDRRLVWGLERYRGVIEKLGAEYDELIEKAEAEGDAEKAGKLRGGRPARQAFLAFLKELVSIFDGYTNISELYRSLLAFTEKFTFGRNEEKKYVLSLLRGKKRMFGFYKSDMTVSAAAGTIREQLETLRVRDAEPADAVMAVKLDGPVVMERKYNFIMGLSASQFGRSTTESPVLSDNELMEYLADERVCAAYVNKRRSRAFLDTLRTADEDAEIIVSSIFFDTVNSRPASPSPVLLSLMGERDFDGCIGSTDIPVGGVIIGDGAWDSHSVDEKKLKKLEKHYAKGMFTVSASNLQVLSECPQRYFFKNILRLPENRLDDPDSGSWLKPNEKGTLCHRILERYIKSKGKSPFDKDTFMTIFGEEIQLAKEKTACDSKAVFAAEVKKLENDFIRYMNDMLPEFAESGFTPVVCEGSFRNVIYTADTVDSKGEPRTVRVSFEGVIDRIDRNDRGEYRMIDYKSGKYKADRDNKNEDEGNGQVKIDTYLQHVVYPTVINSTQSGIEELPPGETTEFSYEYIFSDDPDKFRKRKTGDELRCFDKEVLTSLDAAVNDRDFRMTAAALELNKKRCCTFCTYKTICSLRAGEKDEYRG